MRATTTPPVIARSRISRKVRSAKLTIRPCELTDANAFIAEHHRHHKPVRGHRWSLAVVDETGMVQGVAVVGRPTARMTDQRGVLEVTRVATNGCPNACSALYGRAAAVGKLMGFRRIQTFILESEPGTSLIAAGYSLDPIESKGGDWTRESKPNRRQDQPQGPKRRWSKVLAA